MGPLVPGQREHQAATGLGERLRASHTTWGLYVSDSDTKRPHAETATARARSTLHSMPTSAPTARDERRGPSSAAQCGRRFAVAAAGRTTAPTRDVVFIPSALAAADVKSKDAPLANGPRSTTGTTSEWPAYQIST